MRRFYFYFAGGHHGDACAADRDAALARVLASFPHMRDRSIVGETWRDIPASPWVARAMARELPAKEYAR